MHRVLILLFLAIGSLAFAVDSSDTILQAKSIADTNVTLQWAPVDGAAHYKVFYDDTNLLKSDGSKPVYSSDITTKTEITIRNLAPETGYTFFAHAFDDNNKEISISIPVHVRTFKASVFNMTGSPVVIDEKTIQLTFTRPIDATKTQIVVAHGENKKQIPISSLTLSNEDLRIVSAHLSKSLETGIPYDVTLKKVYTQAGTELAAENKTTMRIIYGSDGSSPAVIIAPPAPDIDAS